MLFKPGDKVRFLDEEGEGIVINSQDIETTIVSIDGVQVPFLTNKLIPVPDEKKYKQVYFPKEKERVINKKPSKNNKNPFREVDLHIDSLIDNLSGYSKGELLEIQKRHFKNELEKAIRENQKKIIFIHGKGEGVLKNEICLILSKYENIEYYDAPFHKYGYGATEVKINNK
jgi:dsDNA-specific endonuclease/ATPase MutS2